MKNAYHILSDVHFAWRKESRKNYTEEVLLVFDKLHEIITKNEEKGYNNILILLGDFFDRGFPDANDAMMALEFCKMIFDKFDQVYAVVGNHELTYYKNNPFWFMVSKLEDVALVKEYTKINQPKGFFNYINIKDCHRDGEVSFLFNHFGTSIKNIIPECKVNIGLFHQNIGSKDIPEIWGAYEDIENSSVLQPYDYLFLGHIHSNSYYGKYSLSSGGIAYYLSSLVRTSVADIDDDYLERNIPVIKVNDGHFECIEDNFFYLMKRKDCIIEEIVKANQIAREKLQKRKEIFSSEIEGSTLYELALTNAKVAKVDSLFNLLLQPFEKIKQEYIMLLTELEGDTLDDKRT